MESSSQGEEATIGLVLRLEEKIYGLTEDLKRRVEKEELTKELAGVVAHVHVNGILEGAAVAFANVGRLDLLDDLGGVAEREVAHLSDGVLPPGVKHAIGSAESLMHWARSAEAVVVVPRARRATKHDLSGEDGEGATASVARLEEARKRRAAREDAGVR